MSTTKDPIQSPPAAAQGEYAAQNLKDPTQSPPTASPAPAKISSGQAAPAYTAQTGFGVAKLSLNDEVGDTVAAMFDGGVRSAVSALVSEWHGEHPAEALPILASRASAQIYELRAYLPTVQQKATHLKATTQMLLARRVQSVIGKLDPGARDVDVVTDAVIQDYYRNPDAFQVKAPAKSDEGGDNFVIAGEVYFAAKMEAAGVFGRLEELHERWASQGENLGVSLGPALVKYYARTDRLDDGERHRLYLRCFGRSVSNFTAVPPPSSNSAFSEYLWRGANGFIDKFSAKGREGGGASEVVAVSTLQTCVDLLGENLDQFIDGAVIATAKRLVRDLHEAISILQNPENLDRLVLNGQVRKRPNLIAEVLAKGNTSARSLWRQANAGKEILTALGPVVNGQGLSDDDVENFATWSQRWLDADVPAASPP